MARKKTNINVSGKPRKIPQRSGRGTHGSLTKAGRVRASTPKVPKKEKGPRPGPRINNRRKYIRRLSKS